MKKIMLLLTGVLFLCISASASATPYTGADIMKKGREYSEVSGLGDQSVSGGHEWYIEGDSIWTAWANEWVEYEADLTAGTWNIGLNAINHGALGTDWYGEFRISSSFGSDIETITILASDDEVFSGFIQTVIDEAATYTIRYTWLNDKYAPASGLDANIQITSVFFDDVNTAPVPEPATMLLFGIGLLGISGLGRKVR